MQWSISTFLAWRYCWFRGHQRTISAMLAVSFIGIFIGTFSLMMTLIITNGFEKVISEKMQGISAQLLMHAPGNQLDYPQLRSALEQEFPGVFSGISGSMTKQVLIDRAGGQQVLVLRGIDELHDNEVTSLEKKIVSNNGGEQVRVAEVLAGTHVIVGHKFARDLLLEVGDRLEILVPESKRKKQIMLHKAVVTVGGIFDIGLEEYDNNVAFCSLDLVHDLFDEAGVDQVQLTCAEPPRSWWQKIAAWVRGYDHERAVLGRLRHRFPHLRAVAWHELYPALVSSLKLEKYVMFLIIALITLVASMNMISLLFMQIASKRRDIAILRTLGCSDRQMRGIFVRIGLLVTVAASLAGLLCAAVLGFALERYPFIKLPDVYYVSYLPARVEPVLFVIVFVTTVLLGLLAVWFPAYSARRIHVVDVLRSE